jgi:hypothetical protein
VPPLLLDVVLPELDPLELEPLELDPPDPDPLEPDPLELDPLEPDPKSVFEESSPQAESRGFATSARAQRR